MNNPEQQQGLFRKYDVKRLNDPAGKHDACDYFVIDRVHDKYAPIALRAYALACAAELPELARDLLADPRMVAAPPGVDGEILDELAVQGIVACEGTASPSMEWDTCALALARSHERLRADRSQLIATLMKEREERLLPGSPADAADVARRLVEDFASAYRCDACNARASMPEDNKADAVRALTPILIAWLRVHGPIQIPDDPEQRDTLRASIAFDLTDTSGERRMVECDRARLDELLTRCIALQHRHDEMEDVFLSNGMPEGEPHPDAWWAARNQALRAEQEAKRAEREATFKPFVCAYCNNGRTMTREEIAAHIASCDKHPMHAASFEAAKVGRIRAILDSGSFSVNQLRDVLDDAPGSHREAPVPIAPGIARTVALLRSWGFETTDSGDGVANVEAGVEGARDYPHVAMVVPQHENLTNIAALLQSRLRGIGIELQPVGADGPCLQASYDPASGVAILDLMNVHDGMLPPESALAAQEGA